jgi:hypothetical protein
MSYTLHYQSSRQEIWRLYWGAWRAKLWRVHVFMAGFITFFVALSAKPPLQVGFIFALFVVALPIVIFLFAAWPQLMFKNKERTLDIGPKGWSTQIGRLTGKRTWGEVASVAEENEALVITSKNGNALVVPLHALQNPNSWGRFVSEVQAWHHNYAA